MIVCVTGGRDYTDCPKLYYELDVLNPELIITGGCSTGADKFAHEYAKERGLIYVEYNADWKKNGRSAGPIRNDRMIQTCGADLLLVFPGGAGTKNCRINALKYGMPIKEIPL